MMPSLPVRLWQTLMVVTAAVVMGHTAHAQVTFDWPANEPDIATYSTPEDCLGALTTYHKRARAQLPRLDTLPSILRDTINTLSAVVRDAAERCGGKFTSAGILANTTLEFNEKENTYRVMLSTGNTTEARTFSDLWLASIPANDDTLLTVVRLRLADRSLDAAPVWFAQAIRLAGEIPMQKFWVNRMQLMANILGQGIRLRDTANANYAARWLASTPGLVGDSIVRSNAWQDKNFGVGRLVYSAQQHLHKVVLLDSLRSGTQAYNNYLKRLRDASGLQWEINPVMARSIVADYWFPEKPDEERPRKGVVSIVLTTGSNDCGACLGAVAVVKRLKAKFPGVEFTLLARTRGWHGLVIEPPTAEQEAILTDSIWRRVHHLPATIAIHQTQFWRLPEPDRRRVNEGGPNEELYPTLQVLGSDNIYLIDRAGEIITSVVWWNRAEEHLVEFIEALVNQRP